jgi:hypothetical protein
MTSAEKLDGTPHQLLMTARPDAQMSLTPFARAIAILRCDIRRHPASQPLRSQARVGVPVAPDRYGSNPSWLVASHAILASDVGVLRTRLNG